MAGQEWMTGCKANIVGRRALKFSRDSVLTDCFLQCPPRQAPRVPLPQFSTHARASLPAFLLPPPDDCVRRVGASRAIRGKSERIEASRVLSCYWSSVFCHIYLETFLFCPAQKKPQLFVLRQQFPGISSIMGIDFKNFQDGVCCIIAQMMCLHYHINVTCNGALCLPLDTCSPQFMVLTLFVPPIATMDYLSQTAEQGASSPWAAVQVITHPGVARLLCYLLSGKTPQRHHASPPTAQHPVVACAAGDELPLNGILRVATTTSCNGATGQQHRLMR